MKKTIIFGMLVSLLAIPTFAQEQAVEQTPNQDPQAADAAQVDSMMRTAPVHFTAGSTISLGFGLAGSGLAIGGDNVYSAKNGLGYNASIRYTYYVYKFMGVTTGLDFSTYSSTIGMKGRYDWAAESATGIPYSRYMDFDKYGNSTFSEVETVYMLEIPLALSFKYKPQRVGLMGTVGMKLGFPVSGTYQSKGNLRLYNDLGSYGVENDYNLSSHITKEDQVNEGVYKYDRSTWSTVNGSVFAEFGALFEVHPRLDISLSVFGSYGVNNIVATQNAFGFARPSNNFDNAEASMPQYKGLLGTTVVNHANPWSVGAKIGLNINCRKKSDERLAAEAYVAPEVVYVYDTVQRVVNRVIHDTVYQNVYLTDTMVSWILEAPQFIYYEQGDAVHPVIEPENLVELLASALVANRSMRVILEGHASAEGTQSYNQRLAYRRAETIGDMLQKRGVRKSQINVRMVTRSSESVNLSDKAKLVKDRRVDIIPVKPGDNVKF